MDDLIEFIVKKQVTAKDKLMKAGMVALCVVLGLVLFMFPNTWTFLLLVAGIVFAVIIFRNLDLEYEYLWFKDELTVDKIIAKANRRKAAEFSFSRLEAMAPVGHESIIRLSNNGYKVMDYSSKDPEARVFSAFVMCNNELVNLLFEPSDTMLEAIRKVHPRNVYVD